LFSLGDILVFLNTKNVVSLSLDKIKHDYGILYRQQEKILVGICRQFDNKTSLSSSSHSYIQFQQYLLSITSDEFYQIASVPYENNNNKQQQQQRLAEDNRESRKILSIFNPFTKKKRTTTSNVTNKSKKSNDEQPQSQLEQQSQPEQQQQQHEIISINQNANKRNPSPNRDSGFIETDGKIGGGAGEIIYFNDYNTQSTDHTNRNGSVDKY